MKNSADDAGGCIDINASVDAASAASSATRRIRWWTYLLSVAITFATLAGRIAFADKFDGKPALILFILPIFLSAYIGGLGPGLISTAIFSLGAAYYLTPPLRSFAMASPVDTVLWLALIIIGVLISVLVESLHAARRSESISDSQGEGLATERKVQTGFALALVFLAIVGAMSVFSVNQLRIDTGWTSHTEEVISSLRLLLSTMTDAETAERGYIISGAKSYLASYGDARQTIDGEVEGLRKLTGDNPIQQTELDELEPRIAARLVLAERNIAIRQGQELSASSAAAAIAGGKVLHDEVRGLISKMEATERDLLREREDRVKRISLVARTVIIFGGGLAFVFVAIALFVMKRGFAVRLGAEAALREARDRLEIRVQDRTVELEKTNFALRESGELFSEAFRLSPDCLSIVRLSDRTVLRANEAVCRLWGCAPEDVIGKPTGEYSSWLNEDLRLAFMQTLREKGECIDREATLQLHDGKLAEFSISSRMITLNGEACMLTVMRDITERKEAEEARRDGEARFQTMVNSIPQLAWVARADGFIYWYNDRWYEYTGTTSEHMEGWGWQTVHDPEVLPTVMENWMGAIASGEPWEMEFPLRGSDGKFRTFLTRVHPVKDADGHVVQWFGTNTDIDVLKRMEESLHASQSRLNSALAAGSIGTWTWDIVNDRLTADEFTAHMFSIDPDAAAIGLPAQDYIRAIMEEDQSGVAASLASSIQSCGKYDIEYRVLQENGELRWLQAKGRVEGDAAGNALNFHGAVIDITERQETDRILRESEEYFRFLNGLSEATRTLADPEQIMAVMARMLGEYLHVSRCAYADVEKDSERFTILHDYTDGCASTVGTYQLSLFGNRAVTTLLGGQTLIIRNVAAELLPGEGADMFNAIGIKAIITCPLVKDGGLRAMMAVHQSTPRDWTSHEITTVQDVVERCWATIERRTAEENIHLLNAELEQRVVERTLQLEAANNELEAFSYSVSHDLRAPLRAVDGYSQAVLEDFGQQLPEEGHRYLRTIRQGAQQMAALIDDLLGFARLSRQSLNRRTVDTEKLVRDVIEDMGSQREGRQIEIHIGDLPPCLGDPALLKQAWVNLLSNALKYTRKCEKAVLEIGCTREKDENVYFVRDNGTGFDMQYAHKLFGVFQRLHRAEDYEGTGVGLAIVQRVVLRHGGRVWAEAAVDRGATFYFTLEENIKS